MEFKNTPTKFVAFFFFFEHHNNEFVAFLVQNLSLCVVLVFFF